MTMNSSRLTVVLAVALAGCGPAKSPVTPDSGIPAFRGLLATPRQLAFTCVVPGCDSTHTVKVSSNVNRRIAIKRIVLSSDDAEFTLSSPEAPPFILGAASDFDIDVRLLVVSAPASEALNLLVTYTDASATESPDRIEAGELSVPLVKRLVGEPVLSATPQTVSFGVVGVSQQKQVPVTVSNAGFGNIALEVDQADSGVPELTVGLPANLALVPDAGVSVPFTYAPQVEGYLKAEVQLSSSTPGVEAVYVNVEGTSYNWPRVVLEPEETALDFGEIPNGQQRMVTVKVANVGGRPLAITSLSATDPSNQVTVTFPGGMTTAMLDPLQRLNIDVAIHGTTPGIIDLPLHIVSNDPVRTQLDIPIRATITEPKLQANPLSLDWGTTPQGWVVSKPIELKNIGYGALTVKNLTFIGGTSNLFSLKNLPVLPMPLDRNGRVAFEVEFRAQTAASFTGSVSIETDDPSNPFSEVPLTATGGSCTAGCPIAHGTPACDMGACSVGMCDVGWYDTNLSASDGCECQEIGTDPSSFCTDGVDKGTLSDSGSAANFTGLISSLADHDQLRFFGYDASQLFSDSYNVVITLTSGDPNIVMCVSRHDTPSSTNVCSLDNQVCGIKSMSHRGSYGHDDSAMYYIDVYRTQTAPATCTPYTLYMTNG